MLASNILDCSNRQTQQTRNQLSTRSDVWSPSLRLASIVMVVPQASIGWFHGKSIYELDENWGYPHDIG